MSFEAMAWAVKQPVPAMQKLVLLLLANRTNPETGQCTPSHEGLATDCGMTSRAVKMQIAKLEDAGYLTITPRSKSGLSLSNHYTLAFADCGRNIVPPRGNDVPGGGEPRSYLGGNDVPTKLKEETKRETVNTYIAEPAPKKYSPLSDLLALGVDGQVAMDWLEVRKAKKSPPTKTAIDGVLKKLAKAGYSANDGITLCAERGWAGFDASWLGNQQQQQPQRQQQNRPQSSQLGPAGQATAAAAERLIARLTGDSNANQ